MAEPKTPQRIEAIDALRGFALIGIFFINITSMGGPMDSEQPPGVANLADPNWRVWLFGHLFVYGAMRGLFSMLFGASALLFLREPSRTPQTFAWRCFWLWCFGVVNSTLLLWPGDILFVYALAGPVILLFLRASPARLLTAGVVIMVLLSAWSYLATAPPETTDAAAAASALAEEGAARLGDYWSNLRYLCGVTWDWTFTPQIFWWIFDAAAFMLIGMALYKSGLLNGDAPLRVYIALALLGFGLGLPLRVWEATRALAHGGEFPPLASATFQFGRLAVSLGWLGFFMLLWRLPLRVLFAPLSTLGRMAFTGYLLQSIVGAFLFAGFGLGLWNRFNWVQLWLLVPFIMAVMAFAFMLWLRFFRVGPFEWLWRTLTFARPPPLLRRQPAPAPQ